MKDKHNVILILVSSKWLNSLFWRFIISHSRFERLIFSFPRVPSSRNYITTEIYLIIPRFSPYILNFSFFSLSFCLPESSWRFYKMVHQGFNYFLKCSLKFFSKELNHSSSCNFFYLIFSGGVMSSLTISLCVSWFASC